MALAATVVLVLGVLIATAGAAWLLGGTGLVAGGLLLAVVALFGVDVDR